MYIPGPDGSNWVIVPDAIIFYSIHRGTKPKRNPHIRVSRSMNGNRFQRGENSMKFKYCRIQGKELAANTRTGKGIFSMLNQGRYKEDVQDSWSPEE